MRVTSISIHPVKSTAIRPLQRARVTPFGLAGDREWMVVDAGHELVSARELPALFHVTAECPETGAASDLELHADGLPALRIARPLSAEPVPVTMFRFGPLMAKPAGPDADAWLRRALGRDDLRLVYCASPESRGLNPDDFRPDDHAFFQDGSPLSLISQGSVDAVHDWAGEGSNIDARRFRQNIVIEGAEPFAEDTWRLVRIGEVVLRGAGRIGRCVMTTVDPDTLVKGKQPIAALAQHRRENGKTWLGREFVAETLGEIAVGDEVTVLD